MSTVQILHAPVKVECVDMKNNTISLDCLNCQWRAIAHIFQIHYLDKERSESV